jgi:tRNA (guanine26-N2/guanine27-N2)-dimethyltransferase
MYVDIDRLVLANDLSPSACEAMRTNVALNGVAEVVRPPRHDVNGHEPESSAEDKRIRENPEEDAMNRQSKEDEDAAKVGRRKGCRGGVRVNEGDAWSVPLGLGIWERCKCDVDD